MQTVYNVGIYCRLSREDMKNAKRDVSVSIENQQNMLEVYTKEKGWKVYKAYIDDDVTGTTFNRPGFQAMLSDIENGRINCVITKDLSRLGRNYIEAGRQRELFNEYGVRYIAIHDNHDSLEDDYNNISTPIKEIINEMYAADISRKVRSTKKLLAEQGKFANSRAPYGYKKSPENKHQLVIDENVSHYVSRIYELFLGGHTGRAIAEMFNAENVITPNEYYYKSINKPNPYSSHSNKWSSMSVLNIIKNPVYYGAVVNGKRVVKSFKNKTVKAKPAEEWIIVEDMHTPLIDKKRWTAAQSLITKNNRSGVRRQSNGEVNIFAGLLKCADCGGNLVFERKERKTCTKEFFKCSTYTSKGKNACTPHYIDFSVIYKSVIADIRKYAVLAVEDEKKLIDRILKANTAFKDKNLKRYEKTIKETKHRINEIDGLIAAVFEEKLSGNITDTIFKRLSQKYEAEQEKLIHDLEQLKLEYADCKTNEQDISDWIKKIKTCLSVEILTRDIALELIERIEVSNIYEVDGEQQVDLNIVYKFSYLNILDGIAS